jgi:DNA-binding CsgD family transcriptional regulator
MSKPSKTGPTEEQDRAEIIELLHRNRIAVWTHDFDSYASCFVHADYITRWNASRSMGVFRRRGWDDISERIKKQFTIEALRDERNAYETKIEDVQLRIHRDMAWVTFDQIYPTNPVIVRSPDFPENGAGQRLFQQRGVNYVYDAGGVSHEMRLLERHHGKWLIAFWAVMHGSILKKEAPVLHVAADGTVVWKSPPADDALEADDDLTIRNGRVRFRDTKANQKLQAALRWAAARDAFLLPMRGTMPIVLDGGEGLSMKVYWVIAEGGLIVILLHTSGIDDERLDIAAAIFNLSPAQKETARLVMEGLSLPEIAERMAITANTARTHLNRIFEKTGIRTQAALVRVLLSSAPPV